MRYQKSKPIQPDNAELSFKCNQCGNMFTADEAKDVCDVCGKMASQSDTQLFSSNEDY